jgi:hypothetical protein
LAAELVEIAQDEVKRREGGLLGAEPAAVADAFRNRALIDSIRRMDHASGVGRERQERDELGPVLRHSRTMAG